MASTSTQSQAFASQMGGELGARQVRSVYLITYSQADLMTAPTRESFSQKVVAAFAHTGATPAHWSCSREAHADGGAHYHMAVKLTSLRRWRTVKAYLMSQYGMVCHFSGSHTNYFTAWQYVTKEDADYLQSDGHPDLVNPTDKRKTNEVTGEKSSASEGRGRKRKKARLTPFDVAEIIVQKGIKSRVQLLALADEQKKLDKVNLAEFIFNRGPKCVADTLQVALDMADAKKTIERQNKLLTDLLREQKEGDCVEGCGGRWLTLASDILRRNNILATHFAQAVWELLEKGRGKYRNLLITGPANCGKTFILLPITVIFETFSNPATNTFAWVGAEKAEVIFLNDFRWNPKLIPWHDLLLLLEGGLVHLPAPKTHFSRDLTLAGSTPVFATSKNAIMFITGGVVEERETEMMSVRWKQLTFHSQIPTQEQECVPPVAIASLY